MHSKNKKKNQEWPITAGETILNTAEAAVKAPSARLSPAALLLSARICTILFFRRDLPCTPSETIFNSAHN